MYSTVQGEISIEDLLCLFITALKTGSTRENCYPTAAAPYVSTLSYHRFFFQLTPSQLRTKMGRL